MTGGSKNLRAGLAIGAVFLLALGLRLHDLGRAGFWLDEIYQADCAGGPIAQIWARSPANKPPLDYYIQSLAIHAGAPAEFGARLHAAVFGALLVAALGLLGLLAGGRRLAALVASLALALPILMRYSQEGRPYALLLLSETLFLLLLWRMLLGGGAGGWRPWAKLTGAAILCMWSHYAALWTCVASLGLVAAWGLGRPGTRRAAWARLKTPGGAALLGACALALAGAWLPLHARAARAVAEPAYAPFDTAAWRPAVAQFLDIYALGYDWYQYAPGGRHILIALMLAGWIGWNVRKKNAAFANFCALLFVVNFFGMFAFYRAIDHWLEVRYTLGALPPAILLAAMGIESAIAAAALGIRKTLGSGRGGPAAQNILTAAACLAIAGAYIGHVKTHPFQKADWRGLGRVLEAADPQGLTILAADGNDAAAVRHYLKRHGIKAEPVNLQNNAELLEACLLFHPNAFVVRGTLGVTPPGFVEALDRMPLKEIDPGFLYLDARRMAAPADLLARANLADEPCPPLLEGWGAPERVGDQQARAPAGGRAAFAFDCDGPRAVTIALGVRPAQDDPPAALTLVINGADAGAVALHPQWNLACWKLDKERIRQGRNRAELRVEPAGRAAGAPTVWIRDIRAIAWR